MLICKKNFVSYVISMAIEKDEAIEDVFTEEEILNKLNDILVNENIYGLVIGKPYHFDGTESQMNENVLIFSKKI